jgi:ZIP family zinc transporter
VLEAVQKYDTPGAAGGLATGAVVFFLGNAWINSAGGSGRKSVRRRGTKSALPIVLGTVLDGVPESAVLGLTILTGGIGVTMLVAVFLANLPEALAATTGLREEGWSAAKLLGLWGSVMVVSAIASALGYGLFEGVPPRTVAFILAFAAGAILTMLADTMMPEAYEHAGPLVGLATTLGFAAAFAIQSLE